MVENGSLEEATAIVTGASSGIGAATARALADRGARVTLSARREERLREVAADVENAGGEALVVTADVTDDTQVAALIEESVEAFGRLDVVVANAGLGRSSAIEEMDTDTYRQVMDVNVDGAFFTARESIPHLRETSGALIFLSSFAGQYPRPETPLYAATKWWIQGFARSLAGSIGEDGIAVSTINPTEVRTEFGFEDDDSMADAYDSGEVTEPDEVADAVVFAATQDPPTSVNVDVYRRDKFGHF
ncbi:MAG: SDR family oxidoreductase [Halobacteriales archaeon]